MISLPSSLESAFSGLSDACLYGSRKNRSLYNIIPSDHISDFESISAKAPVGEGSDSGAAYSRLRTLSSSYPPMI